jgi:hypothetical protein
MYFGKLLNLSHALMLSNYNGRRRATRAISFSLMLSELSYDKKGEA